MDQRLQELSDNSDIETIAINHERTSGGVISKINDIAYKMYIDNTSIDEIKEKTIEEVIAKKKAKIESGKNIKKIKAPLKIDDNSDKSDIIEIKNTYEKNE
jgi:hypothetical protein